MTDIRHITPDFAVSPQITAAHLPRLKAAGFATVICNRPDDEEPGQPSFAEIAAAARAAGLAAHHIPVVAGQAMEAQSDALRKALAETRGKVLAYCRTGNRSQNLFAALHG